MKILRVKQQDGTLVDIPIGVDTASSAVSIHNTNTSAHADIREEISQLQVEKVDKTAITLGVASDGLMYVFVDGNPVGSGIVNVDSIDASKITSGTLSSDRLPTVPIAKGGTGATTADAARTNLGAAPAYQYSSTDLTAGTSALTTGTLYFVYE